MSKRRLLGLCLITLGLALILIRPAAHQTAKIGSPHSSVSRAGSPSSQKPPVKAIASYSVAPTQPKYISIAALHIDDSRIIRLGLTPDNAIASPSNIYDAGWYQNSAKPGQSGAMFIYGHVSSWEANGIFHDLRKLSPGDDIKITRGDNQVFDYRVVSLKYYGAANVNMDEVLAPATPGRPGLSLMTCAGTVDHSTGEFSQRLVVFASLAAS